jgi:hypothetical protein
MRSADRPAPVAILRLGGVVGACGLAALLAAARPARATEIEAPITATVTASSSSGAVARALDADALTRWCPASEDARGELTIRFARPVKIKKVTVLVGKHDLRKLTAPFHPPIIQASLDQAVAEVDPTENGRNPIELEVFREKQGQVFLLRLEPAARPASDPDERCVSDLEIELDSATWVTGIPDGAASKLPTFVNNLTAAFRACDRSALRRLVPFPLRRKELGVGFAGAELHAASERGARPTAGYSNLASLAKDCRQLAFPEGETPPVDPLPRRSLGPGEFRITGNGGGGITYWDVAWRKDRWVLSRIAFTSFE